MNHKLLKAGTGVALVICMEKLLGFVREIVQAYYYGTESVVDSLVAGNLVISVFFGWIATISVAFTPVYKRKALEKQEKTYTDTLLTVCYLLSFASIGLCLLLRRPLVQLALPGFESDKQAVTIVCVSILSASLLFLGAIQIHCALLAARGRYVYSVISNLCINVIQIIALVCSRGQNIYIVAAGVVLAYFLQWICTLLFTKKTDYRYHPSLQDRTGLKETLLVVLPITLTHIIDDICTFFDKLFASYLHDGAIAGLAYANSLRKVIYSFVTVLIATILYPLVSEHVAAGRLTRAHEMVVKSIRILLFLLTPVILCCVLSPDVIVTLIFQHGAFDGNSTTLTAPAFFAYLLGLIPLSVIAVITKYLYADKKAKYCTVFSAFMVAANIIMDYFFVRLWGHMGLALATSLAILLAMPCYLVLFARIAGRRVLLNGNMAKIAVCMLTDAGASYLFHRFVLSRMQPTSFLFALLYLAASFIFCALMMWLPTLTLREEIGCDVGAMITRKARSLFKHKQNAAVTDENEPPRPET